MLISLRSVTEVLGIEQQMGSGHYLEALGEKEPPISSLLKWTLVTKEINKGKTNTVVFLIYGDTGRMKGTEVATECQL